MRHPTQSDEPDAVGAVAPGAKHATGTKLHPLRVKGRKAAAAALAAGVAARGDAGDDASNYSAIAKRFAINKNTPAFWCDPRSCVAAALGDVLALPRELSREVLTRALASLDEGAGPNARDTLAQLAIELGHAFEGLTARRRRRRADQPAHAPRGELRAHRRDRPARVPRDAAPRGRTMIFGADEPALAPRVPLAPALVEQQRAMRRALDADLFARLGGPVPDDVVSTEVTARQTPVTARARHQAALRSAAERAQALRKTGT